MLALLFLLLPVAAGYGWYMGRRSVQQKKQKRTGRLSRQYVAGLNFLLSDQPDKAVDLFIELLQVDSQTIDTHLALGNLFRKRGEVDRAIRIHQNLIARPSLDDEHRLLAMMQLAQDYITAGLYDRAESILLQLQEDPEHERAALRQLVAIYQQLKEWKKAISVAQRLLKMGLKGINVSLAHYYCEQAKMDEHNKRERRAIGGYKRALRVDSGCVRASLAIAALYLDMGKDELAQRHLMDIAKQDPLLVGKSLPLLKRCFETQRKPNQFVEYLRQAITSGAGITVVIELAEFLAKQVSDEAARALILAELHRSPSLVGFHALMGYHLKDAEEGAAKTSLQLLRELVATQIESQPGYRCSKCGFSSHSHYWQCPSCKSWGEVRPICRLGSDLKQIV